MKKRRDVGEIVFFIDSGCETPIMSGIIESITISINSISYKVRYFGDDGEISRKNITDTFDTLDAAIDQFSSNMRSDVFDLNTIEDKSNQHIFSGLR